MNASQIVLNRFFKIAHFMMTTEGFSARKTAGLLLHYVWKLYGTLLDIVSVHGP